ncbi:aspartate 4-decarboxylase [Parabacteroides sp. PF5-5]|uniref:aspartate 4-decarboxylase n=1 Tax=unclassified Parabacteroides TaxID=2649774 RepID=UPI0024731BB6|nr:MULTISPECIES: aspartate 4-decarboxylase [unclassified Parabacteroides]MDH6303890.1 aspartate 4-decarboxylase [Parabacteroides sp. PH5-39]MDH6314507.1 aspartate 4-decarboxylase [Parabacteroides sp. PF5-13]MDH6318428.1 aspartate 4-decarboxylase [Parabacteroides sp. PH5-13]MDH6322279.1 aspartate 4-decarboxylase [Parabacteroides sp. PH5-8]MDH6325641.1 aspartate 4-decarboxylase [Parabacteroides sp. PH5-41]
MDALSKLKTSRKREQLLQQLSPFELKDNLIKLASDEQKQMAGTMLNAGRGNPNWTATTPREAFFTLGYFGLEECRRSYDNAVGMAGIPQKDGIAKRFESFLQRKANMPGVELLKNMYEYGINTHNFVPDEWVMELAEGIIGDQYPSPVRMLKHTEVIVHDYLIQEMCGNKPVRNGRFDLFAVEGGTAAMCYIFDSLIENRLLKKGDRIALGVPAFTPYLEIPQLERYQFKVTYIQGSAKDENGNSTFQYPDVELDKLGDKAIKAFFIINPSNPTSVEISDESRKYIVKVVKNLNPNLMILTDDVYGTFVEGFNSLMNELPRNTLCVYSFSKYFGATGWRLGVIALYEDNVYDDMLSAIPEKEKERLKKLYESLTIYPEKLKFIDRLVADSRQVALNHTAGLSLPQQMQMLLFASFALLDKENKYKQLSIQRLHHRYDLFWEGMKIETLPDSERAAYYLEFDVREWALKMHGKAFVDFLEKNFEPVDIVFRLAEKSSIVLLNGGGFAGPKWSVRVSLANLDDEAYKRIGEELIDTMLEYVEAWDEANKK